MTPPDELTNATTRLRNAKAATLELDYQERVKTLRSTADTWKHIQRFAEAMRNIPIAGMHERKLWLDEIASQLDFSKTLLKDKDV